MAQYSFTGFSCIRRPHSPPDHPKKSMNAKERRKAGRAAKRAQEEGLKDTGTTACAEMRSASDGEDQESAQESAPANMEINN